MHSFSEPVVFLTICILELPTCARGVIVSAVPKSLAHLSEQLLSYRPLPLCVSLTSVHGLALFIPVGGEVVGRLIDHNLNGQLWE